MTDTQEDSAPKLVRRRENRRSTFKLGRTIGEKREKLETANERFAARKKIKKKKALRVAFTILGFATLVLVMFLAFQNITGTHNAEKPIEETIDLRPTIEIVDEASSSAEKTITARMYEYIARAENDFRDLGYKPTKAVFPAHAIREIDFYLEGYNGFIKLTIDRDSAMSVEDADRMLRYLTDHSITDFTYIDVRVDGKAYYK